MGEGGGEGKVEREGKGEWVDWVAREGVLVKVETSEGVREGFE